MGRRAAQLNIRSDAAKQRVADLVYQTGKTATQVVEEAVMAYRPLPRDPNKLIDPVPDGFEIKGRILVQKTTPCSITMDDVLTAIDEARDRPLFYGGEKAGL